MTNILFEPPTKTINDSLSSTFSVVAKIATVSPIDKVTSDKNSTSNFRPISILSIFSKIFEAVIKVHLLLSKKRKQYVRKKYIWIGFKEIISGVHQGFNTFLNDFFYFTENGTVLNFVADKHLVLFC